MQMSNGTVNRKRKCQTQMSNANVKRKRQTQTSNVKRKRQTQTSNANVKRKRQTQTSNANVKRRRQTSNANVKRNCQTQTYSANVLAGMARHTSGMASCSMCTHRAASSSCLVKHVLKVHQHHANFVVHCSHTGCGQTYRKWKSFVQHLRRRHGDDSGILNTTEEETSMDPVPDLEDTSSA